MMEQARRVGAGRPREWVLDEEIVEIHRLSFEIKEQNPTAHWSDIKEMLETRLEEMKRTNLLSKLDKLLGLMRHAIPLPPRCICGDKAYSYTYRKSENEQYWEIFARCTNPNCRFLRRYLPSAGYRWSRPKSIIRDLERMPTFYELDGQKVEGQER